MTINKTITTATTAVPRPESENKEECDFMTYEVNPLAYIINERIYF